MPSKQKQKNTKCHQLKLGQNYTHCYGHLFENVREISWSRLIVDEPILYHYTELVLRDKEP